MYKLSQDDTGLCCTANGLSYGGIPLVAKAGKHFRPCQPEIDSIAKVGLTISPSGLQSIASFLNKGELAPAMIGALHLRLPDLEALRLVKAGYDPNEPRDDHGRWTSHGDGGDDDADADSSDAADESDAPAPPPATHPTGPQYADSGQIMSDASPAGPDASATGTSQLNVNAATTQLINHVNGNTAPGEQCATYVRQALAAGGVDINPHPVPAREYGPYLESHGLAPVSSENYIPQQGDVVVMQPYPGGNNNGHISMYTGSNWISDYVQRDMWGGPGYRAWQRNYQVYRAQTLQ